MYRCKIWDKKSGINGKKPSYYLRSEFFCRYKGDFVLVFHENNSQAILRIETVDSVIDKLKLPKGISYDVLVSIYADYLNKEVPQ